MREGAVAEAGSGTVAEEDYPPRRRLLRLIPALALLLAAFAVWAGWRTLVEHRAKVRLREEIRRSVAAREAAIPVLPPIGAGSDAAPTYAAAFVSVDRPAMNRLGMMLRSGMRLPSGQMAANSHYIITRKGYSPEKDLPANARALELFERAVAFPANSTRDPRKWRWGEMAILFAFRAATKAELGDVDGALRDLLVLHRAARQWRGPWPFRIAPDAWNLRVVELLTLFATDRRLGATTAREGLAALLSAEECRGIQDARFTLARLDRLRDLLELLGDGAQGVMQRRGYYSPSSYEVLLSRLRGNSYGGVPLPRAADAALVLETMRRFEEVRRARGAAVAERGFAFLESTRGGLENALARESAQYELNQHVNGLEFEMHVGLVRTALALRIHEAETGVPPRTLEELVPGILPALPEDPFTGKPFEYKVGGGRWILTSIGPPVGIAPLRFPTMLSPDPVPVESKSK